MGQIPHHLVEQLNRCDWWQRPKAFVPRVGPFFDKQGRELPGPEGDVWFGQGKPDGYSRLRDHAEFAEALKSSPAKINAEYDSGGIYIQHEQLPELAASGVRFAQMALANPELRVVEATGGRSRKR